MQDRARTVLVTGGARGIGAACARRAAARGDRVVVWDRLQPTAPIVGVEHRTLDVRDSHAVERAASELEFVDLAVTAAGITGFGAAEWLDGQIWDEVLATNLHAPFRVAQALHPALRRARGVLVTIGSITAHVPGPGRIAYCTSKAGVLMLTKVLALEWAAQGIRVNSVSPGYTRTDMVRAAVAAGDLDERRILDRIPQGRMAEPDEIAGVVLGLAEPAFAHVTGADVVVDGGWTANGAY